MDTFTNERKHYCEGGTIQSDRCLVYNIAFCNVRGFYINSCTAVYLTCDKSRLWYPISCIYSQLDFESHHPQVKTLYMFTKNDLSRFIGIHIQKVEHFKSALSMAFS